MLRFVPIPTLLLLAACGGNDPVAENLENAAEVSDPAAAAVLNDTAEALREQEGAAPPGVAQEALQRAGEAAAGAADRPPSGSLQAKPNLPQDSNRPTGGQPPAKVSTAEQNEAESHEGHGNEH